MIWVQSHPDLWYTLVFTWHSRQARRNSTKRNKLCFNTGQKVCNQDQTIRLCSIVFSFLFDCNFCFLFFSWSFGVLLWEIYSLGALPYPDVHESKDLLAYLKQGSRMSQPVACAKEIYDIMLECWSLSADSRPSFNQIRNDLDRLLVKKVNWYLATALLNAAWTR